MAEGDAATNVKQVYMLGKTNLANGQGQFFIKNDPIVYMAVGDQHVIVLTETGRAFAFGDNSSGQLGLGHTEKVEKVSCIKALKFTGDTEKVILAACGTQSSIVATNRGSLYAFGSNSNSQLGFDSSPIQATPKKIESLTHYDWKQLAMGAEHTCALTTDGEIFVWGSNEDGQCGQGAKHKIFDTPKELRLDRTIVQISCGNYHTAAVDNQGKLFVFGNNDDRQLGIGKTDDFDPQEVEIKSKVKQVACGNQHTVVLTTNGQVYTCGSNSRGQLGLGQSVTSTDTFELVENAPKNITSISAGEGHTALINHHGSVYLFGDGKHGKLGVSTHTNEFEPYRVDKFKGYEALEVICGGCLTIILARKRSKDEIGNSESEEDSGAATLSVTQKPKSQARVNRSKSMAERSQNFSGSVNATMKASRTEETSNHLRVEPALDSDDQRSDNELSASMKSFTFNQTHATMNGKFRPTQDPTLSRTNNLRKNDEELKPLRTGVLDRTNRLNPEPEPSARASSRSPQPPKNSINLRKITKEDSDESSDDLRSGQVSKRSAQITNPTPKKPSEQTRRTSSSDSEREKSNAVASKNRFGASDAGQKKLDSKPSGKNLNSDDSSSPSTMPRTIKKTAPTHRDSDDSDDDTKKSPPQTNIGEQNKQGRFGNKPTPTKRNSTTSESDSDKRKPSERPKANETPRTNRSNQRGHLVEEPTPSARRPLPVTKSSRKLSDSTESSSDDDDDDRRSQKKSPESTGKDTNKAPDPAPRQGAAPSKSDPKGNQTTDAKDKDNEKDGTKSAEPGFFARLFGSRPAAPEKNQNPNANSKPPAEDKNKESKTCSVM